MIVACAECDTKYSLPDENVPEKGVRVRCPKCKFVWRLKPAGPAKPEFEKSDGGFTDGVSQSVDKGEWSIQQGDVSRPSIQEEEMKSGLGEINIDDGMPLDEPEKVQETTETKKKKVRAKRLARVFVSDILVYNQEKRDKALAEGKLMSVLGPEIKKGWEGYKEKIGSEITESTGYFKDALNEILADGQKLF
jgi:predicted Zn finger-like uncharacterized protein